MRWLAAAPIVAAMFGSSIVPAIADRPVVLELFTSQGCSSCPPADALLRELSLARADILPLSFHVTYWDRLGWRDPFSLQAATARQQVYGALLATDIYTPQLVVDGRFDVVGSDRAGTLAAIRRSAPETGASVPLSVRRDGGELAISAGAGAGGARLLLIGYDREHTTHIGRGENSGATLTEENVVRSLEPVAAWTGTPMSLRHALPPGEHFAVILQAEDGRILGAARETANAS